MGLRDLFRKNASNPNNNSNNNASMGMIETTSYSNPVSIEPAETIGGENCIEKMYGEVKSDGGMSFYIPYDADNPFGHVYDNAFVKFPDRYYTIKYQECVNKSSTKSKCDGCKCDTKYLERYTTYGKWWGNQLPFMSVMKPRVLEWPSIHNSRKRADKHLLLSSVAYDTKTNRQVEIIGAMPVKEDDAVNHYRLSEYKGRYMALYLYDKKEYEYYETIKILDVVPMKPFLIGEGLICYLGIKDEFDSNRDNAEKVLCGVSYIDTEDDEYHVMKPVLDAFLSAEVKAGDVIDKALMMNISFSMPAADINAFDEGIRFMEEYHLLYRISEDQVSLTSFGHSVIYDEFIGLEGFNPECIRLR